MGLDQYSTTIAKSRYARWDYNTNKREDWSESVTRLVTYLKEKFNLDSDTQHLLQESIYNLDVMPSMRLMWSAGKAVDKSNIAAFNCSYTAIDDVKAFDEIMYILLNGTGVGFSVDRAEITKLPSIPDELYNSETTIVVADSKLGWASSYRELISLLYSGKIPKWDLGKIRKKGSILKTFGGRASGPEPLNNLFNYTINLFKESTGRKLTSIEVHGLVCKIASIVVVGGVRRSALISLSNLSDDRMRHAKSGQWWVEHPEYALANNSAIYTEKPDIETFIREWLALVESKSGERGIINNEALLNTAPTRRKEYFGTNKIDKLGVNPCSEISLQSKSMCNLSEVVIRKDDTLSDLKEKVKVATILGTLQSMLTDFPYLRKKWIRNVEEERLLGVSLTGIMDHPVMSNTSNDFDLFYDNNSETCLEDILDTLKQVAVETNKEWADKYNINRSVAITCVKPSGTVSQLVNSSSGIHPRYSEYYIRTIRQSLSDPLTKFLQSNGVPNEPAEGDTNTVVFSFPIKSPEGAITADKVSAIDQLELWKIYKNSWAEHTVSCTVYVKDYEWLEVGAWVYENFDSLTGVSFLPYTSHSYKQAPYQPITKKEYEDAVKAMPNIDWEELSMYEEADYTVGASELACTGGVCEI